MKRTARIALAASASLAFAACGSGGGGSATTATTATTNAGPPTTLTARGYAALVEYVRVSKAGLSPSRLPDRCDRLGRSAYNDEVGAIREVCVTVSDIEQAAKEMRGCEDKTPSDALATRRCIADGLDRIAAYASDAVDAVRRVAAVNRLAPGRCRSYLLDAREVERFQDFARTARSTARTLRDSAASQTRLQQASTRLEIAIRRFERTGRSRSAELAAARACRPA